MIRPSVKKFSILFLMLIVVLASSSSVEFFYGLSQKEGMPVSSSPFVPTARNSIDLGTNSTPDCIAYDPANTFMYVTDYNSNQVSVINTTTNSVFDTINVDVSPFGIVYDPANQYMYVSNHGSDNVFAINTSTNSVSAIIDLSGAPGRIAYDPLNSNIYVALYSSSGSGSVSIIDTKNNSVSHSINISQGAPSGISYDSYNSEMYAVVSCYPNTLLLVINSTTNSSPSYILSYLQFPNGIAYSPIHNNMFIAGSYGGKGCVFAINSTTNTISNVIYTPSVSSPNEPAFDPANNYLYVTSHSNPGTVTVIDPATQSLLESISVGSSPLGIAFDPLNSYMYVANQGSNNISLIAPYEVSFTESGLPAESVWYINVSGQPSISASAFASINLILPNGTYSYTVSTSDKTYYPSPLSGSFTVSGKQVSVPTITFALYESSVSFKESGLPSGTTWYVNLTNGFSYLSTTNTVSFDEPNGTYSYFIETTNKSYSSPGGSFTINGTSITNNVTFTEVTYSIKFTDFNLQSNTLWYVNLSNGQSFYSTSSTISFSEMNGTYFYNVASSNKIFSPSPSSGSFQVNGVPVSKSITFLEIKYTVAFNESGLPIGTSWYVNITGLQSSGPITETSYNVSLTNGTYSYSISTENKDYAPNPHSGSITVYGSPESVPEITFSLEIYNLTFTESGLLTGTWYVNLSNGVQGSAYAGSTITFSLPNETYSYTVATSNKLYHPSLFNGTVDMKGDTPVSVLFIQTTYRVQFTESGLPFPASWYVNISGQPGSGPITSSIYTVYLQNRSYSLSVASANKIYAPSYVSAFTVNGSPLTIQVNFNEIRYNLIIQQSGLPSNTEWNLTFEGTTYQLTNSSYTFSIPNGTYSFIATSHDYKDVSGTITVNGSSFVYTIKMELQLYEITFTETGLPSGMFWYVNISGMASSGTIASNSYSINLLNGSYQVAVSTSDKNYAPYFMDSFTVMGINQIISIAFEPVFYSVVFSATNLPSGDVWYVNLTNGMSSGPIISSIYTFSLQNGSYSFRITSANKIYEPSIVSGSLTVNGTLYSESIAFSQVKYTVTFTESGLSSETVWYVNLTNGMDSGPITSSSFSFSLTNGSYSYSVAISNKSYSPLPSSGSFIINGNPLSEYVIFSKVDVSYTITFTESGLPSGVYWYVNGSGLSGYESSQASISFNLSNGTYSFTVTNLSSYYTTTTHFTVVINGKNVTENVNYYHWAYITGSITPTNSNLTINGKSVYLTSSGSFNISVPNGTYHVVISCSGYISYYSNFTLNPGKDKNLTISLKHVSQPATVTSVDLYIITGAVIAVAAIGVAVMSIRRRK